MDEANVELNLGIVGKENFVTYYEQLADLSQTDQIVAEAIAAKLRRTYKNALDFQVDPSRRIIRAGQSRAAMLNISRSRVSNRIKQLAGEIAKSLEGTGNP